MRQILFPGGTCFLIERWADKQILKTTWKVLIRERCKELPEHRGWGGKIHLQQRGRLWTGFSRMSMCSPCEVRRRITIIFCIDAPICLLYVRYSHVFQIFMRKNFLNLFLMTAPRKLISVFPFDRWRHWAWGGYMTCPSLYTKEGCEKVWAHYK